MLCSTRPTEAVASSWLPMCSDLPTRIYLPLRLSMRTCRKVEDLHPDASRRIPQWSEWLAQKECSGGAVLDLLIHDIDQAVMLFGAPRAVSAVSDGEIDTIARDAALLQWIASSHPWRLVRSGHSICRRLPCCWRGCFPFLPERSAATDCLRAHAADRYPSSPGILRTNEIFRGVLPQPRNPGTTAFQRIRLWRCGSQMLLKNQETEAELEISCGEGSQ